MKREMMIKVCSEIMGHLECLKANLHFFSSREHKILQSITTQVAELASIAKYETTGDTVPDEMVKDIEKLRCHIRDMIRKIEF